MKGCVFGLDKMSNRYSTPNNLRGNKLSCEYMNRTMKMKCRKVEEINTARSEMEMYNTKRENEVGEGYEKSEKKFFKSHSRILRGNSQGRKSSDFDSTQLHVKPRKKEQKLVEQPKAYYFSQNLEEKMNLYLNNLINKKQEDIPKLLNNVELKIQEDLPFRKTTYNTRHLFWKKMKRFVSQKKSQSLTSRSIPLRVQF